MTTSTPSVSRDQLLGALDDLLQPAGFKDYGPNGLQVEGKRDIRKVISGVTASLALIDAAIEAEADAVFVHHGLFWRGQDGRVTGWMKQRLSRLLAHDINLFAYHLPLDAHPTLGNNAQLAQHLGIRWAGDEPERFGEQSLGFLGRRAEASPSSFAAWVEQRLHRAVLRWRSGLFRVSDSRWSRSVPDGRDLRAAGALRPRMRRGLYRLWPPCLRALRCARSGRACGRRAGDCPCVH